MQCGITKATIFANLQQENRIIFAWTLLCVDKILKPFIVYFSSVADKMNIKMLNERKNEKKNENENHEYIIMFSSF